MSETVHYRGKLIKIEKWNDNETLEQQCKRVLEARENCEYAELDTYHTSYAEILTDEYYHKYITHNDTLYTVEKQTLDHDEDIFIVNPIEDGYEFEVKYYNGGCGFNEAIAEGFNNLERKGK